MQALDLSPLDLKALQTGPCSSLFLMERHCILTDRLRKADLLGRVSISAARLLKGFDEEIKLEEVGDGQCLGAVHP